MMESSQGRLTPVQFILKEKLEDIVKIVEIVKDMVNSLSKDIQAETRNCCTDSLHLVAHLDCIQEKISVCTESVADISKQDDMIANAKDASDYVKKSTRSSDPSFCDISIRLETLEEKLSSLENIIHTKFKKVKSKFKNTKTKFLLIDEAQMRNDEVNNQIITDCFKLRMKLENLVRQQRDHFQDFEVMKRKIEALEILRDALNQVNKNVSSRSELSEKLKDVDLDLTSIKITLRELQSLTTKQETKQTDRAMSAFVAQVGDKTVASVGKVIRFSKLMYNKENCFNVETSHFRAPTPGLYFFSVSLNSNSQGSLTAAISHNGKTVALCGTPNGIDFQASTSVLLELAADDKVWAETYNMTSENGVEVGPGFSNFLGVQLRTSLEVLQQGE